MTLLLPFTSRIVIPMLTAFLLHGSTAYATEVTLRFSAANTGGKARASWAKWVKEQETFVVTHSQAPYQPKKHGLGGRQWGWDPRLEFIDPKGKNEILTSLKLTLNGKRLTIPPEHLADIFNPTMGSLYVARDREKHVVSVGFDGGNTPAKYGVTFRFEGGKYWGRSFSYVDVVNGEKKDTGLDQIYVPK